MTHTLQWSLHISPARVTVLVGLLVIAVWMMIRHVRRAGDRATRRLELLRALILALLAVTWLQPEVVRRVQAPERLRIAVLCDVSPSMDTPDVEQGGAGRMRRSDWARAAATGEVYAALADRYDVDVREVCAPPAASGGTAATDLHAALESALASADSLRAVVLLSDGDWNAGPPPSLAAGRLRALGVPIYTITVGRPSPWPDVSLETVAAPAYALAEERVGIPVEVRNRMDREVRTEVRLIEDGRIVDRQPIRLAAQSRGRVRLHVRPATPGEAEWTIDVPPEPEETDLENNRRRVRVPVRREVLRVLLADTLPRWEYRYLRNALVRDPGTEVKCWLAHPQLGPGGGRDYLPAFPSSRAELSTFDVVVLGDLGVGEGGLTASQAGDIRGLVEHQGGGLILIAGRHGHQSTLARTDLGDLLPVEFDPAHPRGQFSSIEGRFELTPDHREHPLVQLADEPAANELLWRALPGFFWHASVRSRPGTDVLAVHAMARNEQGRVPLIVARPAGLGRVLFMGTDAVWRWRQGVEDTYHYRFWGQVIRWMAHRRHLAHAAGLRWFTVPERPRVGDRTRLQAIVPVEGSRGPGGVEAIIVAGDGQPIRLMLAPTEPAWGLHECVWTPMHAGPHQVTVRDGTSGREISGTVEVADTIIERVGEAARPEVMREIAAVSGGHSASPDEVAALLARIRSLPAREPAEERVRIWCHPLWGGAIGLAMVVYWIARKLAGKL